MRKLILKFDKGKHDNVEITNANDIYNYIKKAYKYDDIERIEKSFGVYIDGNCRVIGYAEINTGGITDCPVDIRVFLQNALLSNCVFCVFVHNHPSGKMEPSTLDIKFTEQLNDACKLLNIKLIDSVIINKKTYYSFAEEEKL